MGRTYYGFSLLSDDLNITGGEGFNREDLSRLSRVLETKLQTNYGLDVKVGVPIKDSSQVNTWRFKMITRPEQKNLPSQKINIDICAIPSYDRRPMVMRNHYGVDMGTAGLIIQAQSREEILADKIIAFALRPNRLKNRDLWDIGWLKQQNVDLPLNLIPKKIADHRQSPSAFQKLLKERKQQLFGESTVRTDFVKEMSRFLPPHVVVGTVQKESFWNYLTDLIGTECDAVIQSLNQSRGSHTFKT